MEEEPSTPATPGGTPKPVFTKTLKGDMVEPGEDVGFTCEVTHPLPYFVTWLKDNKPLDDKLADRIQQQDSGQQHILKVLNCHKDDSGIYTAKATDENHSAATCSAQLLVQEFTEEERARRIAEKSPFFLVKMKPTEVIENTNLSYTIHVKGDPMPDVQFLKNEQEIVEDDRVKIHRDPAIGHYEMLISHVKKEDEGMYKCVARNKYGKTECEAQMAVSDEQLVYEALSGKGSLLASGEKAEFKWFRDGQEFDPLERFNVMFKDDEDTLALVFQNVTPEDAGLYTCVASTSCGKISCSAELTVEGSINRLLRDPEPPSIKEEMTDTTVSVGGSAMLECKIGGYPKPDLTWTKNGLDLETGGKLKVLWEDEESVALVIKNVEERDAGLYCVVATNDLGQVESTAKLAIRAGPKIKKLRKEVPCVIGDNLEYNIEVEGEPTPVIHIMVDGRPVEATERVNLKQVNEHLWTLTIKGMIDGDCGTYTVVAVNDVAQVSDFFTIAQDSAPQITRELDNETEKKLHMDVILEVRATGSPKPDARWFKNGKEIMADERFKMTRDDTFYTLKIRRVERTDKGTYKCVLSNTMGEASTQGDLWVRAPPDFVTPLKDVCAKEGTKEVKLFVEWEANPPPTVKWYFKDKPVREDTEGFAIRGAQDTSQILVILEATPEFVGPYTVKAANEYGESTCKGRFRLHEPPTILQNLKDTEFLEFQASKFTFKAFGIPLPDIKWTKDGKKYTPDERRVRMKVEGEDTFTLIFEEALPVDSGHYVATVSNVEGTVTTEADLTVNTPPHIKSCNFNEGKTLIAHHKFMLEVEATSVPQAEATWYLNDQVLNDGEDGLKMCFDGKKYTLERIGSDPEHTGEYKCVLRNKIAEAEEKGNITVKEKEARVRNKLKDIYVKEHTDAELKCQIVGDPIPEVQWFRDGKPLPVSEKFEVSSERMSGWHTLIAKGVKEGDKCSFTVKGKNQHGECETTCQLGVLVKPAPGPLEDCVVDFGKDLQVSVTIHAFPKPVMVWTLNGQELKDGGESRYIYTRNEEREEYGLIVQNAVLEDDGKLAFTATNDAGSETRSCHLKVHYEKPTIVGGLENTAFCLEQDGTFTFRASGLPLPECSWTKNGIPLKNDNKHDITNPEPGVYCLTIKDVDQYDFGDVSVVAKSLVGECTSSATLTQKKMECSFVESLDNVTHGPEGDDVTVTVKVRGSPRPKFVWSKDGDEIEASAKFKYSSTKTSYCEATINLTIVEASAIDSGQYRLRCMNDVNEITTETAFIVRPERRKPKVTKKPQELKVLEQQPGIFQAKIIGFPKPEVKWLKDGRQVFPSDVIDIGVTAEGLYYLEFSSVTEEDKGRYTVTATNDLGSCEADTQLSVVPPPSKPEFLQSLRSSKVIMGYPVRMEVKLGGSPAPEIQWLKDGQPLTLDGKHYKQVEGEDGSVCLQIDEAVEGDAGEFTCVAKNPEGDTTSSARLSVLGFTREDGQPDGPAKFTEGLKDIGADEGDTLRLPVCMKGGPVPKMKWYKDGKEIKLGDRVFFTYDGDRAFLEIKPAKGTDSGMYKCVIENEHGKAETECEVSVRKCFEPPSFTSTFCNQYKLPGHDVKMGVKYDGLPLPEVTWYHDAEKIVSDGDRIRIRKDGEGQTLLIKDCTYSDSGVYRVVAKNKEGSVEYKAELFVSDDVDPKKRPEAPVFLKVIGDQEVFEGSKALFKAIVMGRPEPEFRWYKDGHPVVSANRFNVEKDAEGLIRLSIRFVSPEDAGVYQLKAWNDYGEAACTGKLICETLTSRMKRPVGDEYQGFDKIRRSGVPMPLPDRPMISALSDRRATISWMPHLTAPPTQPVTYLLEMAEYPEGDWTTVRTGIRGCSADVSTLLPKSDYRFRVRVANKHGVSEPSPYVQTYRHKLELPPVSFEPWMDPNYDYKGEGPFVPEGFRISRDARGNYYAAPRFLRLDHDTQYGMRGFNASIKWYAYGYPLPKLQFFKNDFPLDVGKKGSRYTYSHEATGAICLFIDRMTDADIGSYECVVRNEYGQSRQRIKLDRSEYPRVLQPLEELHLRANNSGKIMCRISGYPGCEVKWYRDWEPLPASFKFRPSFLEPDWYVLNINGASVKDAGLYSVAAVNVAGSVHSSCMVHVEEDDIGFYWSGPSLGRQVTINSRRGPLEDHYDIGDELGRGTQGVSYHCVEHHTGRNFCAKSMWGKDNFKAWMRNEFEMINQISSCKHIVRLYDAYESVNNMVLVTELCGGGDLLGALTTRTYITEYEVCWYVRQLLLAVDHMHDRCMAHLGINVGDILLVRPNGMEIKLADLSLARHIRINNVYPLDYGMPEFVAPEIANGEDVTYAADMWAIGVVTYILLTGTSPFRGENDRETLTKVKKGEVNFDMEAFSHISDEAKDFIIRCLDYKVDTRMEAKSALRHPWLDLASNLPRDPYRINTDRLRTYYSRFRDWYANASCKRWFRRRTLASCFTHPSKMVYPPGELYTPPESPEREIIPSKPPEEYHIPERDYSYELDVFKNDSNYQMGPDTYLLQLKDVEFPCRLRSYMKVAEDRSPSFAMNLRKNDYDYSMIPIVHERRRFTDVMDEEIDEDRRKRRMIDRKTVSFIRGRMETCALDFPRSSKTEVTTRLALTERMREVKEGATPNTAPFMREKPQTTAISPGGKLDLTVAVSGVPEPGIQWFKNDIAIAADSQRVTITTKGGRSTLSFSKCKEMDAGLYKVVARNDAGQVTHKFRLIPGHQPGACDTPEITQVGETEMFVKWTAPIDDGGSRVICYMLEMKISGEAKWTTVADNIDHEFFKVSKLTPDTTYFYRVSAKNCMGWGDASPASPATKTHALGVTGALKMTVSQQMLQLQRQTESGRTPQSFPEHREIDYSKELEPVKLKTGDNAELQIRKYNPVAEVSRGRFGTIAKCVRSDDQRTFVLKVLQNKDRESQVKHEYEIHSSMRHERIVQLLEAYSVGAFTFFVMEPLSGMDILTYLATQYQYNEQHVYTVVSQVLDALSYLHWRGYSHLDVQPDNIVVVSTRRCDVKLVDLGSVQKMSNLGSDISPSSALDYTAPEILLERKAHPTSDVWSLGCVIYALLAGRSAFGGVDDEDTTENVQFSRFKLEYLNPGVSQEVVRFLMLIFKRDPSKRPTVEECWEHKWLVESDYMARRRERATFYGARLQEYDRIYHGARVRRAIKSATLLNFNDAAFPPTLTYDTENLCIV